MRGSVGQIRRMSISLAKNATGRNRSRMSDSSLWRHLDAYPPIRVRLLAKQPGSRAQWIPDDELAISADIPLTRIRTISKMTDWSEVTFGEMKAFCAACRFDPTLAADRNRILDYEYQCLKRKSQPFQWLRRSPRYQSECVPLIKRLHQSLSRPQHVT